mgnify:CR=1 FL=1
MKNVCSIGLGIVIGIMLTSMTVYAAYQYQANEVSYSPANESWEVENVKESLDELYERVKNQVTPTGDATASDVKQGVTFWNANTGAEEVGTMSSTNGFIPEGWEIKTGTLSAISGGSGTVSYDNTKYIPLVLQVNVNLGWSSNSAGNVTYRLVGTNTAVSGTFETLTPMTSYSAGVGSISGDLNLLRLTNMENLRTATGIVFSNTTHSVSWNCTMWLEKVA